MNNDNLNGSDIIKDKIVDGNIKTGNPLVDVFVEFGRVSEFVDTYMQRQLRRHNISTAAFRLLLSLGSHGGSMSPKELHNWLHRSKNTVTLLINGLAKKQFIERVINDKDFRSFEIRLSPKGLEFVQDLLRDRVRLAHSILPPLNAEETQQMYNMLCAIRKQLEHLL